MNAIKSTHKAIQTYYQTLQDYREHEVGHETALRSAFQNLLADTAKTHHFLLVPEQSTRSGGKRVVPDGTVCDDFNLHRGYWEAKDTDDDLDAEIVNFRSLVLAQFGNPMKCLTQGRDIVNLN